MKHEIRFVITVNQIQFIFYYETITTEPYIRLIIIDNTMHFLDTCR